MSKYYPITFILLTSFYHLKNKTCLILKKEKKNETIEKYTRQWHVAWSTYILNKIVRIKEVNPRKKNQILPSKDELLHLPLTQKKKFPSSSFKIIIIKLITKELAYEVNPSRITSSSLFASSSLML